jgi:tetratricopeptide (TPR) repeat protein
LLLDTYAAQGAWPLLANLANETVQLVPGDPAVLRYAEMKAPPVPTASPVPTTPLTPEMLVDLSLAAYQRNDFRGCIQLARLALKQRPDYPEAYNNLIAAYNSLGRWDDAIEAGREALRLRPDYQLARNNLAWAESHRSQTKVRQQ